MSDMKVYQIHDKATGEKLVRVVSDCVKRARLSFYATKGFGHYGEVICREIKGEKVKDIKPDASKTTQVFFRDGSTYTFTHDGRRITNRGMCEKCNTATNWIVMTSDRPSYWCGC